MSSPPRPLGKTVNIVVHVDLTTGKVTGVSNSNPLCDAPCVITWQFQPKVRAAAYPITFGSNSSYFQLYGATDASCVSYLNSCTTQKEISYSIKSPNGHSFDPSLDNQPTTGG